MNRNTFVGLLAAILSVAVVYMIVRDDKAQRVIRSIGDLFSGSVRAVIGG